MNVPYEAVTWFSRNERREVFATHRPAPVALCSVCVYSFCAYWHPIYLQPIDAFIRESHTR